MPISCHKSKALGNFSVILTSGKDFGFSATIRRDITKNYDVEQNLVSVMEGDGLILASTANFRCVKLVFFVRKQKCVGRRFKELCKEEKKS